MEIELRIPILEGRIKPVAFYPYTTDVYDCLVKIKYPKDVQYQGFIDDLIKIFKSADLACHSDNKIAFGVEFKGTVYYIGFYDWTISIGLRVDTHK